MRPSRGVLTAGYSALLVALGFFGLVLSLTAPNAGDLTPVSSFIYLTEPILIAAVAGLLATRRPDSWAGWTLLVVATAYVGDSVSKGVIQHHLNAEHWTDGLTPWAAWVDNWTWTVMFGGLLYAILRFAQGTPHGRRLRAAGWAGLPILGAILVISLVAKHNLTHHEIPTAIHLNLDLTTDSVIVGAMFLGVTAAFLCAGSALVIRRHHSAGAERAQLRWLLWSFGSVIGVLVISEVIDALLTLAHLQAQLLNEVFDGLSQLSTFTIPIAFYVSVTRYGLFEIDKVVSRTASYATLTAMLTISYVVIVTATTRLLPDRFNSFGVALATLAVAALFLPVRRHLLAIMDRRFNRGRVNAEQVINAFAERVRRDDAHDPNGTELLAAVHQVFQPACASIWVASQ
jgi:hypothetical protein